MRVYINRPDPKFKLHNDTCGHYRRNKKANQRIENINSQNLSDVLKDFLNDKYLFSVTPPNNDMWLNINLSSREQDESLVYILQAILGSKDCRLAKARVNEANCLKKKEA